MTASKIIITGNPIFEVLTHYQPQIEESNILQELLLGSKDYFLATIHRAENVDNPAHLSTIVGALNELAMTYKKDHPEHPSENSFETPLVSPPIIASLYRTSRTIRLFDFIKLEKNAFCVLTDSGTVQEECCIFHIPTVTVRKTTERPETVDCGSNFISGLSEKRFLMVSK